MGKVTASWSASLHGLVAAKAGDVQLAVDLALFCIPMVMTIISLPADLWCAASARGKRFLAVVYGLGVAILAGSEIYRKHSVRLQQLSMRDVQEWFQPYRDWVIPGVILLLLLTVIAVVLISIRRHPIASDYTVSRHSHS